MSETPRPGDDTPRDPSQTAQQPSWGSAYPPPPHNGGYPPPPGTNPYAMPMPRKHSDATTSMVLGIVSVAGAFMCVLPVLIAPFAWYMGAKATREIDASHGTLSGRGEASAGKILGIIGTVLLVLAIAGIVLLVVLTFTVDGFWDEDYDTYDSVVGALGQVLSSR